MTEGERRKAEAARFAAEAALRAGRALTALKKALDEQWLDALEARGVSQPTAWWCMQFAAMPESARKDGLARHRSSWRKAVEEWARNRKKERAQKRNGAQAEASKDDKVEIPVAERDDRLAAIARIHKVTIKTVEGALKQRLAEASDDERADLEIGASAALEALDQHLEVQLRARLLADAGV